MATTFPGNAMTSDKIGVAPRFCIEANKELLATFSECSGLSATVRSDKWEEGGANYTTLKFPGRTDFGNLTLKHGVSLSTELFDWFMDVLRGKNSRRDIAILLRTQDLDPLQSWHFSRAFPVKWTGPTLQATSNTVAIESIEFAHDGFVEV
jgi:phage tail-like protein